MNKAPACSKIRTWGTIIYCRRRPTMSAKTLIAMIATVTASFAAPTMVPTVVKNYFRENMVCGMMPLSGQVAVVAGATRGAGRGIARALGEAGAVVYRTRSEEHTSELQSRVDLVCRLLLEKKKTEV